MHVSASEVLGRTFATLDLAAVQSRAADEINVYSRCSTLVPYDAEPPRRERSSAIFERPNIMTKGEQSTRYLPVRASAFAIPERVWPSSC